MTLGWAVFTGLDKSLTGLQRELPKLNAFPERVRCSQSCRRGCGQFNRPSLTGHLTKGWAQETPLQSCDNHRVRGKRGDERKAFLLKSAKRETWQSLIKQIKRPSITDKSTATNVIRIEQADDVCSLLRLISAPYPSWAQPGVEQERCESVIYSCVPYTDTIYRGYTMHRGCVIHRGCDTQHDTKQRGVIHITQAHILRLLTSVCLQLSTRFDF